jgi:hypothetical protein
MASLFGNATTRGEAIVSNARATIVDRLFQVEVTNAPPPGTLDCVEAPFFLFGRLAGGALLGLRSNAIET